MNKKQVLLVGSILVFTITMGILNTLGQGKNDEIREKLITIKTVNKPLCTVFGRLIFKYDIPIGFEESILDKDHDGFHFETNVPYGEWKQRYLADKEVNCGLPEVKNHLISISFKDARLEDVITEIVRQMQNYDWEIYDGVVNIFPVKGRDPRIKKLLDLKINEFSISRGTEVGMIQPLIILELPEFKEFLAENNLYAESDRTAPWFIERPLPEGMKFSNLTFKELLNSITKSKRGGWILKVSKIKKPENEGREFIDILI